MDCNCIIYSNPQAVVFFNVFFNQKRVRLPVSIIPFFLSLPVQISTVRSFIIYHIMCALPLHSSDSLDIYSAETDTQLNLPLMEGVRAGFPSPAADFIDLSIDLNRHLIKHPSATFYARVKGESMKDAGISDGDLLIIDRSIDPVDGKIAICFVDGEFTLKRIKIDAEGVWLIPANAQFKPLLIKEGNNLLIWGVVTYVVKSV